jgi:hypothetical protein
MGIIFFKFNEFKESSIFIVDFWNDDTKFVTQIDLKSGLKKYVIIILK